MKTAFTELMRAAIAKCQQEGVLPEDAPVESISVDRNKNPKFGDLACNAAMVLAKSAKMPPRALAEKLIANLPENTVIAQTEIAGPGFINIFLKAGAQNQVVLDILAQKDTFGHTDLGHGARVILEFVSVNPTGPLHVGHGRGAAYGASLANLLEAANFDVHREYYVNDAGRQMHILATSLWLRYLQALGAKLRFPTNGYQGDYLKVLAKAVVEQHGDTFASDTTQVFDALPPDEGESEDGDKEKHIDALIERAKSTLSTENYQTLFQIALENILADIRDDLDAFGVKFDAWFSEQSLLEDASFQHALDALEEGGHLYQKAGATWFRSSSFGDDKDRVIIRENGQSTYFATDIAYHENKIERGYDQIIDIFGADHHGYLARLRAAMEALTGQGQKFSPLLVQFAVLYRGKEKIPMSTRRGEFVTLRELREEVGSDACRFFYVMRKPDQHMDFDVELAKSQTSDNPVYYIQYAHARICRVEEKLLAEDPNWTVNTTDSAALEALAEPQEQELLRLLGTYPELLARSAQHHDVHTIAHFLTEIAGVFHRYYNQHQFLIEDTQLRDARMALILAVRQVIRNGLAILGVSAPTTM